MCVYVIVELRWTNTVKQKICEDWICFLAQGQHSFLFIFMCSTPITSVNDDAWPDNNSFACFMATFGCGSATIGGKEQTKESMVNC